jgi:gluconolactonase
MAETFEIVDEHFRNLVLPVAGLEKLHTGGLWVEGPAYFPLGNYVVWSDIPNNRMFQYVDGVGVRVFRHPSNNSNGNTRDREGRLLTCEHDARRVTRTEHDGRITVLADSHKGRKLNSPNDVVVKSDGSIWFTDPPYGILAAYEGHKAEMEQAGCYVYRLDPQSGALDVVIDDMHRPNGLAFSPDETKLYVSDTIWAHDRTKPRHIKVYDVVDGKRARNGREFVAMIDGCADGIRCDSDGYLWSSAADGVHCYAPSGKLMGKIKTPEIVSNLCFGGPKRNRLFITGTTSLYAVYVAQTGAGVA